MSASGIHHVHPGGATAALTVKEEGSDVDAAVESIDLVGGAVTATTDAAGHVTVTVAQAAFVDPTTATPEDIANALIAAGLMAAS